LKELSGTGGLVIWRPQSKIIQRLISFALLARSENAACADEPSKNIPDSQAPQALAIMNDIHPHTPRTYNQRYIEISGIQI
jgi:hypothetical protein